MTTSSSLPPLLTSRGRLFVSIGGGVPDYRFAGAARLDGLAAARAVTRVRKDAVVGDPVLSWSGSLAMRSSASMRYALLSGQPIDMLVLFGGACQVPDEINFDAAVVIEDVVVTGGQSGPMTVMSSGENAIVDFTLPFLASNAYVVSYPLRMVDAGSVTGCVVALAEDKNAFGAQRFYGLCAQRISGGASWLHLVTMIWADDILRGGGWHEITIGEFPAPSGPNGGVLPYSIRVMGDKIYATVPGQIITMPVPPSYGPPRSVGYTALAPAGETPKQSLPLVQLAGGHSIGAPYLDGEIWSIDRGGAAVANESCRNAPSGGGGAYSSLDRESIVFADGASVVAQHVLSGRQRQLTQPALATVTSMMMISERDFLAFSLGSGLALSRDGAATWESITAESCFLEACRVGRSIYYASTGAETGVGSELIGSVDGGRNWRRLYTPLADHSDIACMLPLASGHVMLGGQVAPSSGYTRCGALYGKIAVVPGSYGRIYLSAPPEQAIVGTALA